MMKKLWLFLILLVFIFLVGCNSEQEPKISITNDNVVQVGSLTHLSCNMDVFWSSSDLSIATVDELGFVKGISQGNVIVSATLKTDDKVFDTLNVTVLPNDSQCDICDEDAICPTISFPEPTPEEEVVVKLGIDRIDEYLELFEGKRVGLITNQTGFNSDLVSTIDVLNEKVNLVALFAPEHGIRGNSQAGSGDST